MNLKSSVHSYGEHAYVFVNIKVFNPHRVDFMLWMVNLRVRDRYTIRLEDALGDYRWKTMTKFASILFGTWHQFCRYWLVDKTGRYIRTHIVRTQENEYAGITISTTEFPECYFIFACTMICITYSFQENTSQCCGFWRRWDGMRNFWQKERKKGR